MKTYNRLWSLILAICSFVCLLTVTSSAVAYGADSKTMADIELLKEKNYNKVIIQDNTIIYKYEPGVADPIPHFENNGLRASSIVVTASDVWNETRLTDKQTEYRAYGYVTAAQYHYSRAEQHAGSWGVQVGVTNYGYNQVDSWTEFTTIPGVAKIFYGAA